MTDLMPSFIDAVFYAIMTPVVVASLFVIYVDYQQKQKETTMQIPASKIKPGDIIQLPNGVTAKVSKIKATEIKIPSRVEKSLVLMVNHSKGESGEYTIGTSNLQCWGHDTVVKVVAPGFFSKFMAFIRSL